MALLILDEDVSASFRSAAGGWNTSVVIGGGGVQYPTQMRAKPIRQFEWSKINASQDEIRVVMEMIDDCQGRAYPFLLKDHLNYELVDELILTAAGGETEAQIKQTWGTNRLLSLDRNYIKTSTLVVKKNNTTLTVIVDYTINSTGLISFASPLVAADAITVTCEFYHLVRFDQDLYQPSIDHHLFASLRSVTCTEDRGTA